MAYNPPKIASQNNTQQKQDNEWYKYLAQARMATMMDGQTALGLALGRLLRGAWDHEQEARQQRTDEELRKKRNYRTGWIQALLRQMTCRGSGRQTLGREGFKRRHSMH